MRNKYQVRDILQAVDFLLGNKKKEEILKLENEVKISKKNVLNLKNEVPYIKKKTDKIPDDTEKIILEAEKYLKK